MKCGCYVVLVKSRRDLETDLCLTLPNRSWRSLRKNAEEQCKNLQEGQPGVWQSFLLPFVTRCLKTDVREVERILEILTARTLRQADLGRCGKELESGIQDRLFLARSTKLCFANLCSWVAPLFPTISLDLPQLSSFRIGKWNYKLDKKQSSGPTPANLHTSVFTSLPHRTWDFPHWWTFLDFSGLVNVAEVQDGGRFLHHIAEWNAWLRGTYKCGPGISLEEWQDREKLHTMWMYTYVSWYHFVHTYVSQYILIHTYIHTYVHTYIHTYIHTYVHHTYTHTRIYIYASIHPCMHACMHTYMDTWIHRYIDTSIHRYIDTSIDR